MPSFARSTSSAASQRASAALPAKLAPTDVWRGRTTRDRAAGAGDQTVLLRTQAREAFVNRMKAGSHFFRLRHRNLRLSVLRKSYGLFSCGSSLTAGDVTA